MMKRRSFLIGASTLTLGQLVSGCNNQQQASLSVRLLQDSIPPQLVGQFKKELKQSVPLKFDPEQQLQDLFKRLQAWKQNTGKKDSFWRGLIPLAGGRTPAIANLVTLGDYWLAAAIRENLIQPLAIEELPEWQQLPSRWRELVERDSQGRLANSGLIWGAPYRWGTTVIAYRRDKLASQNIKPPTDWSDLWNPQLQGRISVLDESREVIGLTLKKLGSSYNTEDLTKVPNLKKELLALHKQVKYYSSDRYLQPLILEDTWVALAWSTDLLPIMQRYREIEAVVPQSGTALWNDVWVQPVASAANNSPTNEWINFCWQPEPARDISLFSHATSPIIVNSDRAKLPRDIRENRVLLPDDSVLNKSEFFQPLPEGAIEQYKKLWKEVRTSNV